MFRVRPLVPTRCENVRVTRVPRTPSRKHAADRIVEPFSSIFMATMIHSRIIQS